jgi:tetratricopeptide (TPR) repeat protein
MKFLSANACLCCALLVILFSSGCTADTENMDNSNMTYFMEKTNESREYYDNLVASDPDNATAWCIRGMYYNDNYSQYEKAMENCNKALELDPECGIAWYLKGVILLNTNKADEAALCFENATKYDPELAQYLPFTVGSV